MGCVIQKSSAGYSCGTCTTSHRKKSVEIRHWATVVVVTWIYIYFSLFFSACLRVTPFPVVEHNSTDDRNSSAWHSLWDVSGVSTRLNPHIFLSVFYKFLDATMHKHTDEKKKNAQQSQFVFGRPYSFVTIHGQDSNEQASHFHKG